MYFYYQARMHEHWPQDTMIFKLLHLFEDARIFIAKDEAIHNSLSSLLKAHLFCVLELFSIGNRRRGR